MIISMRDGFELPCRMRYDEATKIKRLLDKGKPGLIVDLALGDHMTITLKGAENFTTIIERDPQGCSDE
jgi:hypothetical protein